MLFRFIKWFFVFSSLVAFADPSFYHVGQLPNGLTYYIHQDPNFRKHISIDLIVRAGSINEQEEERGFSHLIEHFVASEMKFKEVKIDDVHCPLWDLSGPEACELTSYEFTQYHLDISRAISHGLEEGLKSFSSALTMIPLTQQSLHEHQQDILDEIVETEQFPSKKWQKNRINIEYPPYRDKHPLGNAHCVKEATIEKVNRFFHHYYQPSHSAIIVIGNMDIGAAEELIKRHFGGLTNTADVEKTIRADHLTGQSMVYFDPELEHTTLSMTQIIPRLSKQETFLFSIWTHLLQYYLQAVLSSSDLDCSAPSLEILPYPSLLRLNVSLRENNIQSGVFQLKEVLSSFANTFIPRITEHEFKALKIQIQQAAFDQLYDLTGLRDLYRDLFIRQDSNFYPCLDESAFEAITLERFYQAAQVFQDFSQVSLATKEPAMESISLLDLLPTSLRSDYDH